MNNYMHKTAPFSGRIKAELFDLYFKKSEKTGNVLNLYLHNLVKYNLLNKIQLM